MLIRAMASSDERADVEQWLEVLFETSPIAMGIISGAENRCIRVNQAMADLYGMPVDEILNSDPFSLAMRITHPDDVVPEQALLAEMLAGKRRFYRIEKRYTRPDGSQRWGLLTFSGVFGAPVDPAVPNGPLRFVVVQVIDIDDQKRLQDTLHRRDEELSHAQKVDGIGRLAAGVAHDFNNLLTVITGHGELLRRVVDKTTGAPAAEALRDGVEAILTAAERAAGLTTQLLAYGRRSALRPRTLSLSNEVATLQRLLERTLGPDVEVEQALLATGSVNADAGQLGQVVMNLVLNARDAITEDRRIRLSTRDVDASWVALEVSDTGHGMTPEVQARMFEPFFTTREGRSGTQGTGLGLATLHRIVTDAGGRIDVRSTPGQGTTVTVLFPRVADLTKEREPSGPPPRKQAPPNSVRILVVDDDPPVRMLIGSVLISAQYWVAVARDAQEALRFIDEASVPFDLVVTDLQMPGLGGRTLAERLRDRGNSPPMLFISGYSPHTEAELSELGELLPKPFTPADLLAAVARALQSRE